MSTATRHAAPPRLGGAVLAAFAAVYVIWGSTYLFIKIAVNTIPPLLMAGVRFVVAGGILLAATAFMGGRERDPVGRRQWGAAALTGILLLVVGNGGVSYGEQFVPTGVASLLVATVPLFIALFGGVFLGQRLAVLSIVGIGVGLLGTAVLIRPTPGGGSGDLGHMLIVLASPLCWAVGSLYATRGPLPRRPLVATGMEMVCGGAVLVVAGLLLGEGRDLHLERVSVSSGLALLYLVVFGSIVAFTAYIWLLGRVRTQAVATYAYVNPLVAVTLGAVFLSEPITGQTIIAGALIIAAVVLILAAPHRPQRGPSHEPVGDVA